MSAATTLHQFVVYAPDKKDDKCMERRLAVREKHLAAAREFSATGQVKLGGALLTPESIEGENAQKKMVGSIMIFEASSIKEVEEIIKNDIYYKSDVWDPEALVILPFVKAPL